MQLKLQDIYISLAATKPTTIDADRTGRGQAAGGGGPQAREIESELAEIVVENENVAILGDPGGGKSTLLRYLALHHAESSIAGVVKHAEHGTTRFPILVRVAAIVEQATWRERSLLRSIVAALETVECPRNGLESLLSRKLEDGLCLVLLDGLDEVPDTTDRRKIVSKIEDFTRRYLEAGNRFIVTSRIAGYREAALGVNSAHFVIRDMTQAQQNSFLEKWCRAVEDFQTPELGSASREATARREIAAIRQAIRESPGVAALAVNPLLLRILALIHRTGARLPDRRIELYKLAAETLSQTWRVAQGVPESALVDEQVLTRVLSRLAYWMHVEQPSGNAPYRDVFAVLAEEWCSIKDVDWDPYDPNPQAVGQVESFLARVRVQTGLFVEKSPMQYGFMHLTFEEYYAARELIRRPAYAVARIQSHLHDPRWEEPILLALAFYGLEYPDESSDFVRMGVLGENGGSPSLWENFLHRDLGFALKCVSDGVPVSNLLVKELIQRATAVVASGSANFSGLGETFAESLRAVVRAYPQYDPQPEIEEGLRSTGRGASSLRALAALTEPQTYVDLARRVSSDSAIPVEVRGDALLLPGRWPQHEPDWANELLDLVCRHDRDLLGPALVAATHIPDLSLVPYKWEEVDAALDRYLSDKGSDYYRAAVNLAMVIPLGPETPLTVQTIRRILLDESENIRTRSDAATAVAFNAVDDELIVETADFCVEVFNKHPFEVWYNLSYAYMDRSSSLPPIDRLVPTDVLTSFDFDLADYRDGDADENAKDLLERIRSAEVDEAKAFYIGTLAGLLPPAVWVAEFIPEMPSLGKESRRALLYACREVSLEGGVLESLVDDPDAGVRVLALLGLSRAGRVDPEILDGFLNDPDPSVRVPAFRLAMEIRDRDEILERALKDADSNVRAVAWTGDDNVSELPRNRAALRLALGPRSESFERNSAISVITRQLASEEDIAGLLRLVPQEDDYHGFEAWFRARLLLGDETVLDMALSENFDHDYRIQDLLAIYFGIVENEVRCTDAVLRMISRAVELEQFGLANRMLAVLPRLVVKGATEDTLATFDAAFRRFLEVKNERFRDMTLAAMFAIAEGHPAPYM